MRGVFFHEGLEFRLEVRGQEFRQGDELPCTLTVKNHSESVQSLANLRLTLALGNLKKVKAKTNDAFGEIVCADCTSLKDVGAGQEKSFDWSTRLAKNCSVTDKNQSLYLLFGTSTDVVSSGALLVTVALHRHIESIFSTMETVFGFVSKGVTAKGEWSIAKLKPPTARKFSLVEELNLACCLSEDDSLTLRYVFTVKKFETSKTTIGVKKDKSEIEQVFAPECYLYGEGFVNQEFVEASILEALKVVTTEL